jgi:predicted metal-dependent phosphoesterase TrpH
VLRSRTTASPHRPRHDRCRNHQNGLIYLPHPYDSFRRRCSDEILEDLAELIDIVEVFNGRSEESANQRAADLCEILSGRAGCRLGCPHLV